MSALARLAAGYDCSAGPLVVRCFSWVCGQAGAVARPRSLPGASIAFEAVGVGRSGRIPAFRLAGSLFGGGVADQYSGSYMTPGVGRVDGRGLVKSRANGVGVLGQDLDVVTPSLTGEVGGGPVS